MRAFTVFAAFLAAAVSGVLAGPADSPASIIARQNTALPDIPDQCKSSCAALQSMTSCGSDLNCMCTDAIGNGIVSCGQCGINYLGNDPNLSTYKAQFQASVNSYADACTQAGHKIGPFVVDGASSGSSGSTTATGAGSSTTGKPAAANAAAPARTITSLGALAGLTVVMAAIL
ncbi:hypothetical protein BDV93DRAFT_525715 [Ceratobasidium sp. AG-I]|nr:hypothetical protein BDV93DRAFT_525715 [Ceratobasidium sp. AG-I]